MIMLTNEKRVLRVLTNEKRALRVLTNEKRVLKNDDAHLNRWSEYPPEAEPVLAMTSLTPASTRVSSCPASRVLRSHASLTNEKRVLRVLTNEKRVLPGQHVLHLQRGDHTIHVLQTVLSRIIKTRRMPSPRRLKGLQAGGGELFELFR